jgi:hypothetical protein
VQTPRLASALGALALITGPLVAQVPTDSAAVADSLQLARELGALLADTAAGADSRLGATNPRLLPDISVVGDLVGDFSPAGSTQENREQRFGVREVEIAIRAAVDPYFRGEMYLGISDAEGIGIEQMFLTATALPYQLEARLGRFLMPVGKVNLTHIHDLHTVEQPWVAREFLGEEGLKGDGLQLLRVISPFGWYQELLVTAVNRFGEAPEGLVTAEPVNQRLSGLGYSARLRNYWDLGQATNLELSASVVTGRREQAVDAGVPEGEVNAIAARQTVYGADATLRWRPLREGLYRSFIAQVEVMRQVNAKVPAAVDLGGGPASYLGPTLGATGLYGFARWQFGRRSYLAARYDRVESAFGGAALRAASGYLEFFPSEFSKFVLGYERIIGGGTGVGHATDQLDRILLQASFSLGPHKPHPF